jgi:type VI secretion system secreted protein VgrG
VQPFSQAERPIRLTTPLGGDTLVVEALSGTEQLSRPFEFRLDLLSTDGAIDPTALLRKPVTVIAQLEGGGERYFNGWVRRFVQLGRDADQFVAYRAEVVPWFWFLSTTTNCRIFQGMTVPDIVKKVFRDRSMTDYKLSLSGNYPQREYCVQYRETDMNFVSRLLEEEGIFFFFEHTNGKHTMVLADTPNAIKSGPIAEMSAVSAGSGTYKGEHIAAFEVGNTFFSGSVSLDDYNMETPSMNLLQRTATTISGVDNSAFKLFDYPGKYGKMNDGERLTRIRMEEQEASNVTVAGEAVGAGLACGHKVTVENFYRRDANKPYLVVSVHHTATNGSFRATTAGTAYEFSQAFVGIPATVTYRPPRITPKAIVQGAQTAVVVGPSGEEIYVDKYGRVKVQFFWDQEGKKDENSSCFIRVSSAWAGKQWGFIQIPRIGQEVIVDFLEGDPDRPIIVGRVYNAEQMPPYTLPDNMTQSGGKSRSSKGGGAADFNEFRFEDKKDSELVTLHAQKDSSIEVEHDETHWVGNDRTKNIDHDETVHVKNNRTETVDNDESITIHGGRTEVVDKDETITIHQGRTETVDKDESLTVSGNRTRTVSKDESVSIGGAWSQSVSKDATVDISGGYTVSVTKDRSVTVSGGDSLSISKALAAKAGTSITIEANSGITIKCGQSQIKIDQSGVQISGMQVKVEGQMTTEVKGGMMAKLDGGAMCTVKGAVTMIN